MTALEAIFLGFLQGATEFLPVSSSGHLVMGQELLGITLFGITFEVVVHVATLISVLVVYRERLVDLTRRTMIERQGEAWRYVGLLAVGTLPVMVVGLTQGDRVETLFNTPATVGFALLFTGTFLVSTWWALKRKLEDRFGFRVALLIGLAQCLALIPGVSRSGVTVTTALWLGVSPLEAAAFSFLLSIPAIAGAAILQLPELTDGTLAIAPLPLGLAFVSAAVTGVLAIRLFVTMLRNRSFPAFAGYCWFAGLGFLTWLALG
ncbi:MAG: undecaprenyl-diphosphate phosphatase [Gemmatimonadota bacterium]